MPPLAAGAGPHLLLQTYLSRIASACPKAASNTVFMMAFYKRPPCRGSPPSVMRVSRQRSACLISTVLYQLAFRSLHLHSIPVFACPSSRTSSMLSANQARSCARQSQSAHVLRATCSVPGAHLYCVYFTSRLCRKLRMDGASRSMMASRDAVTQLASKGAGMAGSSSSWMHSTCMRRGGCCCSGAASSSARFPQQWTCASGTAADAPQRAG
jgi:hypothetical protein